MKKTNTPVAATPASDHPFEKAGLGKAPFRFVGVTRRVGPIKTVDPKSGLIMECGAPGQPMGCCDYCGQGIAECCEIVGADGKRFIVGNMCVTKTNRKNSPLAKRVRSEVSRRSRERRAEAVRAELDTLLADSVTREALAAVPHPQEWRAEKGETLLDSVEWMLDNAGAAGYARTLKQIKSVLGAS